MDKEQSKLPGTQSVSSRTRLPSPSPARTAENKSKGLSPPCSAFPSSYLPSPPCQEPTTPVLSQQKVCPRAS